MSEVCTRLTNTRRSLNESDPGSAVDPTHHALREESLAFSELELLRDIGQHH